MKMIKKRLVNLENFFKSQVELIYKLALINPGSSGVGFKWFESNYSSYNGYFGNPSGEIFFSQWDRGSDFKPFDKLGFFELNDASIVSNIYKPDPDVGKIVSVFVNGFRPIRIGPERKYFHHQLRCIKNKEAKKITIENKAALLGVFYMDDKNYFHFWMDVVLDYFYLKENSDIYFDVDFYVIPYAGRRWQDEILDICGIDRKKIIPLNSFDFASVKKLIVPIRNKGGRVSDPWGANLIRDSLYFQRERVKPYRKLYIARLDAVRRPLRDEGKIINFMISKGFEIIECSKMSVAEQINTFSEADIVVGPHGAALTNIIWMKKGTTLFEFMPTGHANACFYDIANQLGIKYKNIPAYQVFENEDQLSAEIYIEYDVFIDELNELLII